MAFSGAGNEKRKKTGTRPVFFFWQRLIFLIQCTKGFFFGAFHCLWCIKQFFGANPCPLVQFCRALRLILKGFVCYHLRLKKDFGAQIFLRACLEIIDRADNRVDLHRRMNVVNNGFDGLIYHRSFINGALMDRGGINPFHGT